ncbi:MAG: hypothetical protein JXA11_13885, partial [Phycisphaerae bacterium]|nr:hypothetical protein [Phycisphaerae bacterium]
IIRNSMYRCYSVYFMDDLSRLGALIDLAERVGIVIRRAPASTLESSEHPGGAWVRLRGKEMLFLNPAASTADQMNVAVEALRGRAELADQFIPPELRDLLDAPGDS